MVAPLSYPDQLLSKKELRLGGAASGSTVGRRDPLTEVKSYLKIEDV